MKKFMWFIKPNVSDEQFRSSWIGAGRGLTAPGGVSRWLRSLGNGRNSLVPALDRMVGLEEIWVEDGAVELVRNKLLNPETGFAAKLRNIADLDESPFALTEEVVIIPGSRLLGRGITNIGFWRKRPELTRQENHAHWLNIHAPMIVRDGGITCYMQSFVVDIGAAFDGAPIVCFIDRETADDFTASSSYKGGQINDARTFVDINSVKMFEFSQDQHEICLCS